MDVEVPDARTTVVTPPDDTLTFPDAHQLDALVSRALAAGATTVVIDLAATRLVDSSGLGALVRCAALVRSARAELRTVGASPRLVQVLDRTRVGELLNVVPSPAPVAEVAQAATVALAATAAAVLTTPVP